MNSRDSAGIRIVEAAWPGESDLPPWRLLTEPTLSIGEVDGDPAYLLDRVGDVLRIPDGRIVVANGNRELRFYNPDGSHLRTVGRAGEGPGEFEHIDGLAWGRDTLFVYDGYQHRVSAFLASGDYATSWSIPILDGSNPAMLAAAPSDGRFVFPASGGRVPNRDQQVGPATIWVAHVAVPRDGSRLDTLSLTAQDWLAGNGQVMPTPFGRWGSAATDGMRLAVSQAVPYELALIDLATARPVMMIRSQRAPVRLDDARYGAALDEALEQAALAGLGGEPRAEQIAATRREGMGPFRSIPGPVVLPGWLVSAGEDGTIWALDTPLVGDTVRSYDVFAPEGEQIGRITLPMALTVRRFDVDRLLGVMRDELGVERVVEFRIERW